jgi:4-diphosphocytidyl-2-C-methyl-D-erythritol kinase
MILFPNAKINLGLYVTAKRSDGYHDLLTAFYPIGWRDVLEIVPAKGPETTLTVSGRGVDCPPEKNLVMRAYRAVAEVAHIPAVDIYLHKVIPDGAGLGGGSSDAAFTIYGLNNLFNLEMTQAQMAEIASHIGADCPFFIYNRPMTATGIGNIFAPCEVSLNDVPVLIVKPDVYVSTREAYAGVVPAQPDVDLAALLAGPVEQWQGQLKNQFEDSVFATHPEIKALKDEIAAMGAAYVSMSGSGSSVYGIFPGADSDKLSLMAKEKFPGMDVFVSTNRV